jgi:hypothetical protein
VEVPFGQLGCVARHLADVRLFQELEVFMDLLEAVASGKQFQQLWGTEPMPSRALTPNRGHRSDEPSGIGNSPTERS